MTVESEPKTFLDIGAGTGERFIKEAQANPGKSYVIITKEKPPRTPSELPVNLLWFSGSVAAKGVFIPNHSIDQVNMDCVFQDTHGITKTEASFRRVSLGLLREAERMVSLGGEILIREPKYMVEILLPLLDKLKLSHQVSPIDLNLAKSHSESIRDAALEFEAGYSQMEPHIISIRSSNS